MRVAFLTRSQVNEIIGGTERITKSVGRILSQDYGVECHSLYYYPANGKTEKNFVKQQLIQRSKYATQIYKYVKDNKIDFLICQNEFEAAKAVSDMNIPNLKVIFVHHYQPGFEEKFLRSSVSLNAIFRLAGGNIITALRSILLAPYRYLKSRKFPNLYKQVSEKSDCLVLLSEKYKERFHSYSHSSIPDSKIRIIPNMLSFEYFAEDKDISNKRKRVLIVSRLEENPKNISQALMIWSKIMQDSSLSDWYLDILGDGPDREKYEKMVRHYRISNVRFYGVQCPENFYKEASILMMTSLSEGWGLTLTEAQQYGCIPVALDTYPSLHDIVEEGFNGFIIEKDDTDRFAYIMKNLMIDKSTRERVMRNGVRSSKRFSVEEIGSKWHNLLTELLNENKG
ncbi:MAG: glycosyltransferase [Muribaculaceae bacterium]|nr:glycosyltransferase [Muribaculaceae bacterium]